MAFLWKHPKSKYWQARFYDVNSKRQNRSTKVVATERNRRQAQKIADAYEDAGKKRRTARQVRTVIAELHKEIVGEGLPFMSVREFVAQWLSQKKHETKASTMAFYRSATNKFLRFLGDEADRDLSEVSRETILAFRNEEATRLAPKTVNHDLKCVRMLFKAARRDDLIGEDPTEFVETVRQVATTRRPFTMAELQAVMKEADSEWRSMVTFGLYTGQRLADVATLTWQNIDMETKVVRLTSRKTGRTVILPMASPLHDHLCELPAGDDPATPLHPKAYDIVEKQGKTGHLSNQFAKILADAGLREKKSHKSTGKGRGAKRDQNALSFHCLRHTTTTLLHDAGVPAAVAQAFIGHDSEEMHKVYVSVGLPALEDATAKLPRI